MRTPELRIAKFQCSHKVKEGKKNLKCGDIYRLVEYQGKRIVKIVCMTHRHPSIGPERKLFK